MAEAFPGGGSASNAEAHEQLRHGSRVAILDAGGQYVDLVQKAVERHGFSADVVSLQTPREDLEASYAAVVISGSPASSREEMAPQPDPTLWDSALPILGICYGMQAMAASHGAQVAKNMVREDGRITTNVDTAHPLFKGVKGDLTGLFTHGDFVIEVPDGFTSIGRHVLDDGALAYSAIAKGNTVGVQFHPEVFDDTPEGYQLFGNFLYGVAGLEVDATFRETLLEETITKKQREITEQVGDRHVIAFMSGGVDSSVAGALAARAISPEKLHAFYIDNGFMRDEDDMVIDTLAATGIGVHKIDAAERFEQATATINGQLVGPLVKVTDPEAKRKIIGKAFIDIQNDIVASLELDEALLLQGTNAADRIESGHSKGGNHTDVIKTHHNQVQEVQDLKARGLLVEPLDDLFKDEVRALGRELGLPADLIERQPFPGPGTAIRIIAAARDELTSSVNPAEEALNEFIATRDYLAGKAPAARILPIKSVGVGGDERSYIPVVALENAELVADELAHLARDVPAHFKNRVIYALGQQSLAELTVTETLLTNEARSQLRRADRIVFEAMRIFNVLPRIQQMPVVLLPVSFDQPGDRSIVLRPVTTSTFMTVQAMLPGRDLPNEFFSTITNQVLSEVAGISQVFLDLTNKPPGTTEWE